MKEKVCGCVGVCGVCDCVCEGERERAVSRAFLEIIAMFVDIPYGYQL